jgi:hypothetical protein
MGSEAVLGAHSVSGSQGGRALDPAVRVAAQPVIPEKRAERKRPSLACDATALPCGPLPMRGRRR